MGKSNPSRRLEKWEDLLGLGGEKGGDMPGDFFVPGWFLRKRWGFFFLAIDSIDEAWMVWGNAGDFFKKSPFVDEGEMGFDYTVKWIGKLGKSGDFFFLAHLN